MWRRVDLVWTDFPPKRRLKQDLHGVTSQKMAFFIVTAVKTSNITLYYTCFSFKEENQWSHIEDENFVCDLVFLTDIREHLNELTMKFRRIC
jgi:hypothetical protein